MKIYNPTESELKVMGFVQTSVSDWCLLSEPSLEYFRTAGKGMRWSFEDRTIYPTSKSDIEMLIKLLTP